MKKIKPFRGWLVENAEVSRLLALGLAQPEEVVKDHFTKIAAGTNWPVEDWTGAELDDDGTEDSDIHFIRAVIGGAAKPAGFLQSLSFAVWPDGGVLLMLDDLGQVPWRRLNTQAEIDHILDWGAYEPVKWDRVESEDWTAVWSDALKIWEDGHLE